MFGRGSAIHAELYRAEQPPGRIAFVTKFLDRGHGETPERDHLLGDADPTLVRGPYRESPNEL